MDELKQTVAKNLAELRTSAKLTQLQLAEMLNYSDKAVSKWERGEAIPDLRTLIQIANIYGITLDDIVKSDGALPQIQQPGQRLLGNRAFIAALSAVLIWFVATGIFTVLYFIPSCTGYAYLVFCAAPLPTAIVLTVFSVKWGNRITNAVSTSLILWSCMLVFHTFVIAFTDFAKIYIIYVVAAVFQVLVILWFIYRWYSASKKTER